MLENGARRPPSYLEGASVSIKIILAIIYYYIAFYYGSDYVPNVASVIISVPVVLVVFIMFVILLVVLAMLVILLVVFTMSVVVTPVVLGVTAVFRVFYVDVVNIFSVVPTYRTVEVIQFAVSSPLTGRENVS